MRRSNPYVGIIYESSAIRQSIARALSVREISVFYDASTPPAELPKNPQIDVWILSASTRREAPYFAGKKCVILDDFLPIPSMFSEFFDDWYSRFWGAVNDVLNNASVTQLEVSPIVYTVRAVQQINKIRPLPIVAVIGASMGGPEAVNEFLQALRPHPELRVLLAHHGVDKLMQAGSNPIVHKTDWQCQYIKADTHLKSGIVYLVPEHQQITVLANGMLTLVNGGIDWDGAYHPCIDDVYSRCSHVFGSSLVSITMSGMMQDGCKGVKRVANNGGLVWAQSIESALATSQIDHVNNTGLTSYSGSPLQLAQKLLYVLQNSTREHKLATTISGG